MTGITGQTLDATIPTKVMIIETKGSIYADKFRLRKQFMEGPFLVENNERHFKYERFAFLYLEDTLSPDARYKKLTQNIKDFFNDQDTKD